MGRRVAVTAACATAGATAGLTIIGMVAERGHGPHVSGTAPLEHYLLVRNTVLCGGMLAAVAARRWGALRLLLAANCATQLGDAGVGLVQHDVAKTVGPLAFAVLLGVAAAQRDR